MRRKSANSIDSSASTHTSHNNAAEITRNAVRPRRPTNVVTASTSAIARGWPVQRKIGYARPAGIHGRSSHQYSSSNYSPARVLSSLMSLILATIGVHEAMYYCYHNHFYDYYHDQPFFVNYYNPKKVLPHPRHFIVPETAFIPRHLVLRRPYHHQEVEQIPILLSYFSSNNDNLDEQPTTEANHNETEDQQQQVNNSTTSVVASPIHFDDNKYFLNTLQKNKRKKDFGGLDDLKFLPEVDGAARMIMKSQSRSNSAPDDDEYDTYFAFDDDWERSSHQDWDDDKIIKEAEKNKTALCRRPSWYRFTAPICNTLHELDTSSSIKKYIGQGHFRDVFMAHHKYLNVTEEIAFKESRYE